MALDRELLGSIRRLDEFDLRRLSIFIRGLLVAREGRDPERPGAARGRPRITYRQQLVRCGRATCTRCPHGPYWYAYWREDGRLRSRYVGKSPPEGVGPGGAGPSPGSV